MQVLLYLLFAFHVLLFTIAHLSDAPCRPQCLQWRTHHCGRMQRSEQGSVCSQSPSSGDLLAALAVTEPLVTPLTSRWTVTIVSKLLTASVSSAAAQCGVIRRL